MNARVDTPWSQHRHRSRWALWWFLLGLPATIPAILLVGMFLPVNEWFAIFGPLVAWAGMWLWLMLRLTRFRCPRCGELFYAHQGSNLLSKRKGCSNCGLRTYDEP